MTKTLIGIDYEGVAAIKITKSNVDPITTLDATPGAFLFNSKDNIQNKIVGIDNNPTNGTTSVIPTGATTTNFQKWSYNYQGQWMGYSYQPSFFSDLEYDIPLTDFVMKSSNGWYTKGRQVYHDFIGNQFSDIGYCRLQYPSSRTGDAGWKTNISTIVYGWLNDGRPAQTYSKLLSFMNIINKGSSGIVEFINDTYCDVVAWNLPATSQALITPNPVVPGQKSVRIDSNGLKIAKPGFDVDSATASQLAVSSASRPIKIIAADDIAIPVGNSEYLLSINVPTNSICDIQYYVGTEIVYPASPRTDPVGADWRLLSDRIQFQNPGIACRARFVVMVNDKISQTVGANNVLRQFTENGNNVVQFLKPGAANPPAFSDIVIDSRWPALRIIKEGYFDVAAGAQVTNIPIDTTGYYPFVKFMVTCGSVDGTYTNNIRPPTVGMYKLNSGGNNGWKECGHTTYAKVNSDNVAFYTFRGSPKYFYWIYNSSTQTWRLVQTDPDPVLGIRYYIFGIPKE